ncbi:MAG: hypothetical protein PHN69_00200 [Candidatus Pacebacteria bacterium]|nr:hypothetical protein [Candidatus Paceibacterota bacterium]
MKVFIKTTFQDMIFFARLVDALQKSLDILDKCFPEETYVVLKIDNIRLKITKVSSIQELHRIYLERKDDYSKGLNRHLEKEYTREGLWE